MQQQAEEEELGLSSAALAALKEFALENNLLDLDGDSDATDVRLQVQDHMDVKERAHDFCFTFEDEDGPDEQVSIALTGVNPELGQTLASTGLTVWRAAEEMARFMWEHRRWFAGKRVVELGAGLGLCGVLASKLCVGGTVVITDGGEEFTDDAMEALRRNILKNSCNLSQDETKAESGDGKKSSPRDPRRSHGKGAAAAGHNGSGNDEDNYDDDGNGDDKDKHDRDDDEDNGDGDGDGNSDCDGNDDDDDDDDDDDGDGVLGGGRCGGGARGAKVVLEKLTWGDHTGFLERNVGGGGGGGGGGGFDFIVAADVIYEEAAVSPLLHTVVDILRLRRTADSIEPPPPPPPSQSASSCPPPPSVSTFLLAFARRNISIDRVLDEAESLGLRWRVPDGFTPTSSSENIYLMCLA